MKNKRIQTSRIVLALALAATCFVFVGPSQAEEPAKAKAEESKSKAPKSSSEEGKSESAESKSTETGKQPSKKDEVYVFTNSDLKPEKGTLTEGRAVEPTPPATEGGAAQATTAPPTTDPLTWLENQKAAGANRQQRIEAAQRELEAARLQVSQLEKQKLAVSNPFSARPELDAEEKAQRAKGGESATQRLERTQKMLDEAKQRVQDAEKELADARAS